ncbi:hypothetical protein GCM10022247_05660 [Allokutzneria multivorans]|uniref:Uncharacterized protein n=1 Tax=Allokutzneria multivorans TaxID=1142134 RepID=A0ABP7QYG1_9PSEU
MPAHPIERRLNRADPARDSADEHVLPGPHHACLRRRRTPSSSTHTMYNTTSAPVITASHTPLNTVHHDRPRVPRLYDIRNSLSAVASDSVLLTQNLSAAISP